METPHENPAQTLAEETQEEEKSMTVEERLSALSRQIADQMARSAQQERQRRDQLDEREAALARREMQSRTREEMEKRGLERTEDGDGKIVLLKHALQEHGEEQTGKADLQGYHQGEVLPQKRFRDQHAQQIQRTGQIIGKQRVISRSHTHIPGELQASTGKELISE